MNPRHIPFSPRRIRWTTGALIAAINIACASEAPSLDEQPTVVASVPERHDIERTFDAEVSSLHEVGADSVSVRGDRRRLLLRGGDQLLDVARTRYQAADSAMHRWSIAAATGRLRAPAALALLEEIATAPLKTPAGEDLHGHFSERSIDEMTRMRAIEGLRDLAIDDVPGAKRALERCVMRPEPSLRMIAVQSLLVVDGRGAAHTERLRAKLEPADRWMVDVSDKKQPERGGVR